MSSYSGGAMIDLNTINNPAKRNQNNFTYINT